MATFFALKHAYTRPHSRSLSYYQQTMRLPKRQVGHGLPFWSRGSSTVGSRERVVRRLCKLALGIRILGMPCAVPHVPQDGWVYPRSHVSFNNTMLCLVLFSIDYHWACSHLGIADYDTLPLVCLLASSWG